MSFSLLAAGLASLAAMGSSSAPLSFAPEATGAKGDKLRRRAYENWYSPWFFDVRAEARKEVL